MKKKQLIILLSALAVAAVAASWKIYQRSSSIGDKPAEVGQNLLPDFRAEDVASITVKSATAEAVVEWKDGKWVVPARENFPANVDSVNSLRDTAFNLKVAEVQRIGPSQLGQVKLKKPGDDTLIEEAGTWVAFRDASGKEIVSLVAGKTVEPNSQGDSPFNLGGGPKAQYIKLTGQDSVVYKVQDGFSKLETEVKNWLDKGSFLKVEKIKRIAVTGATPEDAWTLSRQTEGGDLKLEDAKSGEELDASKASGPGSAFSWVQFLDVAPSDHREKAALDNPERTVVIETFDGFTYTVKVGALAPSELTGASGEGRYLSYNVEGKFPEQRTPPPPGEDGKPSENEEQKKAADEEFAKELEEKRKKLANEQAQKDRLFIVSTISLEPVLKKRGDLLKEKGDKEEKKDEPAKTSDSNPPATAVTPPVEVKPDGKVEAVTPPVSVPAPETEAPQEEPRAETPAQDAPAPAEPQPQPQPAPEPAPATPVEEPRQPAEQPAPQPEAQPEAPAPAAEPQPAPAPEPAPAEPQSPQ